MYTSASSEAQAAIEELRQLGFQLVDMRETFRIQRIHGDSRLVAIRGDDYWKSYNSAAIHGLTMAKAILKDEADRLALRSPVFGKDGSWVPPQG